MPQTNGTGALGYVVQLRRELSQAGQEYARAAGVEHRLSYGESPAVVFEANAELRRHGNFLPASYEAILRNPNWKRRLSKAHSQKKHLPLPDNGCWRELDSCNSSDALLMNVFCYPRVFSGAGLAALLGVDGGDGLEFGYRPRVPLRDDKYDRTEVDMRVGDLLVEAKLTEAEFQRRDKAAVLAYRDFEAVFDARRLPQTKTEYMGYQLIRNVLAAHAGECRFCLLCDARRPDLLAAWFDVLQCVRILDLRLRCKVLTWQELAAALPPKLQAFLEQKYAIVGRG